METTAAPAQGRQDEPEVVRRWRCEQLERAGYNRRDALRLANDACVDVHRAAELLARGCPRELAVRILL